MTTVELLNNGQVGSMPFVLYMQVVRPFTEAETKLTHNILKHAHSSTPCL